MHTVVLSRHALKQLENIQIATFVCSGHGMLFVKVIVPYVS